MDDVLKKKYGRGPAVAVGVIDGEGEGGGWWHTTNRSVSLYDDLLFPEAFCGERNKGLAFLEKINRG